MATLWFAKDGTRPTFEENGPYTQSGPGIDITVDEAQAILAGTQVVYAGKDAPSINPGPVKGPERNVVIEIKESDALNSVFEKIGFYFAPAVRPFEAQQRLEALRAAD